MDLKLPNSPVLAADGKDTPEYRVIYLRKMAEWRDATREQALLSWRNSPEYNNIDKYVRYLEGDQWDNRRAKYKSRFVENKIELVRREKLALFTDTKPIMDVSSGIEAYDQTAMTINKVIEADWIRNAESDVLIDVIDITMLHGTGYCRLGGSSPGKSTCIALGPDNVIPIQPSKLGLQTAAAVYYRNWKPVNYFKKVFPYTSQGIEKQARYWESKSQERYIRPSHIPEYTWTQMAPGFKKLIGGKPFSDGIMSGSKLYGSIELEEFYVDDISINESSRIVVVKDPYLSQNDHNWWYEVRPGERLYPRKRLVIYAGERLMYDGPSPFWHGMYPFEELRLNPVPWSYYGFSSYRSLLPLQDAINELPAGTLDLIKKALHPTIIAKNNVASPAAWKEFVSSDMPGSRLLVNPNINIANDLQYAQIPVVPGYVFQLYETQLAEFDKISGMLDVASLAQKRQMPAGETMDQMRDSLQTPLRREERYIETFLQRCGHHKVSNVIQFYTAKQRLKILGADGLTWEDFLYDPGTLHTGDSENTSDNYRKEYFWTMFACKVEPGSMHSGSKDKSKIEAVALQRQGIISRLEAFRRMGVPDEQAQKILSELKDEATQMAQLEQQARAPRTQDQKNGTPGS